MLKDLRAIIAKYNFPSNLINKAECMACDIYDLVIKEKPARTKINKMFFGSEAEERDVTERDDKLKSPISAKVKDAAVGDKIFIPFEGFNKPHNEFASYVHPTCREHSIITTRQVVGGWIITKIKIVKK